MTPQTIAFASRIHPKEQAHNHQFGRFVDDAMLLCCMQMDRLHRSRPEHEELSDERDVFDEPRKRRDC